MTKFSKMRRRTIASAMETMGVAKDITVDQKFEMGYRSFQSLAEEVMELGAAAHVFLEQAKYWTESSAQMSEAVSNYFKDSDAGMSSPASKFLKANKEIDSKVRKSVACVALESVLNPLREFCSERVPEIEKRVQLRNELRIDYDLYKRRWKDLQTANADRAKMEVTRNKLERARSEFEAVNNDLINEFNSLKASKERLVSNQATALMICQQEFLKQASTTLERALQGLNGPAKENTESSIRQYIQGGGPDPAATAKALNGNSNSFRVEKHMPAHAEIHGGAASDDTSCGVLENTTTNRRWSQNPMFSNQQLSAKHMPALPLPPAAKKKVVAVARHAYQPREDGEVGFAAGDLIEVLEQNENGWWIGISSGQRGEFPGNHVELR